MSIRRAFPWVVLLVLAAGAGSLYLAPARQARPRPDITVTPPDIPKSTDPSHHTHNPVVPLTLKKVIGQIAFNTPPDMKVGVPVTLEARISKDAFKNLSAEISVPGAVQSQKIPVGHAMRLHLTGGENFTIRSLEDATTAGKPKLVSEDADAVWDWEVTALHAGRYFLFLDAEIVSDPSKPDAEYRGQRVFGRQIPVNINPLYNLLHWNWQEIFKTLGGITTVTAIGAWWQKRRSGKNEDAVKPEPVPAGASHD